jgi:hypothetical protein
MTKKSITFVNRHYPPNLNVTGENVWDLATYLIQHHDIEVHIVHVDRQYTGGGVQRKPVGHIHKVKTIYTGSNRLLRYLAGLWDGYFLTKKSKKINKGPIVLLTSPPLLPMWGSMMLKKNEWILWSMDLFPEGFGAIHEIKKSSWFYQFSYRKTYQNVPSKVIALGPKQKEHLESKYRKKIPGTILPCGVFSENISDISTPIWKKEPDKIYFGYLGNCGIPHNPDFVKAVMDAIDPERHVMILVAYGIYADELKSYAKGKKGIQIMDNVPRPELNHIDVHCVTLLPSWTHIAVPSKAVSSVTSGSAMIFCGSTESDNWYLLKDAAWHVNDEYYLKDQVKNLVNSITKEEIISKRENAKRISKQLVSMINTSYIEIASWAK